MSYPKGIALFRSPRGHVQWAWHSANGPAGALPAAPEACS